MSTTSGQKTTVKAPHELRAEHERLVDEANRQPGVAEVVQVYGRLAPYALQSVVTPAKTRYAMGGNG